MRRSPVDDVGFEPPLALVVDFGLECDGAEGEGCGDGSGANGRIWPAMMSAELPEGWA
jgi:hypothetical protein